MMKKIWAKFSYSIILLLVSFATCLMMIWCTSDQDTDKYITVSVENGDSLWEFSEQYAGMYNMSKEQFVKWVEKNNKISAHLLQSGDEIVIPVTHENQEIMLAAE